MDLSRLNQQQIKAVEFPLKPVMVMAGAGTGKTTVLVYRIAYLIEELGILPEKILAITFTNKAAQEMNERVSKIISNEGLNWIGTFHSICIKILRREIYLLNRKSNFKVIDEEDQMTIIKDIYQENNFNHNEISYRNMLYHIDLIKTNELDIQNGIMPMLYDYFDITNENQAKMIQTTFNNYVHKLEVLNYLDFNDLLYFTDLILQNYDQARAYWSQRFDYVLVDEFQDTNDIQYRLLKILSGPDHMIFAVGDEDQTIYSFRGANPEVIHHFVNEFQEKVPVIFLEENYRSTQEILDAANHLINKNQNRFKKNLITHNAHGHKPILYIANSEEQEANWVVNKIDSLLTTNEGVREKDIAILYRSNFLSRPFEQALISEGLKYTIYGGIKFYQRLEIKDLIAYLNVINSGDELSIRRIINTPRRKISDATVKNILEYSLKENLFFAKALLDVKNIDTLNATQINAVLEFNALILDFQNFYKENKNMVALFDYILDKIQYLEYTKQRDIARFNVVKQNLNELRLSMLTYMQKNLNDSDVLNNYLQEVSLFTSFDEKKAEENSISLMTVHTSKGLEFKYVFLVGLNEDIFPSNRSLSTAEDLEEERRIAYVALTRAKKQLYLTANQSFNFISKKNKTESRFIHEIGSKFYERQSPIIKKCSDLDLEWYDSKNKKINPETCFDENKKNTYKIGDKIVHTIFGAGTIIGIEENILEISFKPPYKIKKIVYNHKSLKRLVS